MDPISLLVVVIIFVLIAWLVLQLGLPEPLRMAVIVIFVVILLVWVLQHFGAMGSL